MRRVGLVFLAMVLARSFLIAENMEYEEAVRKSIIAGDLAKVKKLCDEWTKAEPENHLPHVWLGRAYMKADMPDLAIEKFVFARELTPLSPDPACAMGDMFLAAEKPAEAIREYEAALLLSQRHAPALAGIARAKLLLRDFSAAEVFAKKALTSDEKYALAMCVLGAIRREQGELEKAVAYYERALQMDESCADAVYGLGVTFDLTEDAERAQTAWKRFLTLEPVGRRATAVANGWVVVKSERLKTPIAYCPVWSPDGARIMFGYGALRVVNLRDGKVINVKAPGDEKLFNHDWSPDGKLIVCRKNLPNGGPGVFLYELRSGDEFALAEQKKIAEAVIGKFSPDGKKVLLSSVTVTLDYGRRFSLGIAVFDMATGKLKAVRWRWPDASRKSRNHAAWGPDGETIVFHAFGDMNRDDRAIFTMRIGDQASAKQITRNGKANWYPLISPDAHNVAFVRQTDGNICLTRADGGSKPLVLSKGRTFHWSPDGRKLAYEASNKITVIHFGGLAHCSVRISAKQDGAGLTVTAFNGSDRPQSVVIVYELFDPHSARIEQGAVGEGKIQLGPAATAERKLNLNVTKGPGDYVVKLTAVTAEGARTIKLVGVSVRD